MFKSNKIPLQEWWDIGVEYHPTNTGNILINIPGAGGTIGGYLNKYVNLGNYIQENKIASFVRIPNDRPAEYELTVRTVVNYCLENSNEICDSETPNIWLMGFSAGAGAIVLTGWEYPEIKKILAINPYIEGVKGKIERCLPLYTGDLFLIKGSDDDVIGPDTLEYLSSYATNVSDLQTYTIPNCDHQLKGLTNSFILSQLPQYYFLDKYKTEKFPDGSKGINLLDS
jgi:pimeloyl-ACP methyl ester carboxylesterase